MYFYFIVFTSSYQYIPFPPLLSCFSLPTLLLLLLELLLSEVKKHTGASIVVVG